MKGEGEGEEGRSYLFRGEEGRRGEDSYKAIGTHIRYFQLCRIGPRVREKRRIIKHGLGAVPGPF